MATQEEMDWRMGDVPAGGPDQSSMGEDSLGVPVSWCGTLTVPTHTAFRQTSVTAPSVFTHLPFRVEGPRELSKSCKSTDQAMLLKTDH